MFWSLFEAFSERFKLEAILELLLAIRVETLMAIFHQFDFGNRKCRIAECVFLCRVLKYRKKKLMQNTHNSSL